VAESNVPEIGDIDQTRDRLAQRREHASQSGMKKKRLVISDQEMTELQINLGDEQRQTVDLRRNFSGSDHGLSFLH
jgi:hypothetical protein